MQSLAAVWSEPPIAAVELNTGTFAAYGRPYQTIDFYNDQPELFHSTARRTARSRHSASLRMRRWAAAAMCGL
ncbi:MAG: hypothetical protein U0744_03260 [Gemmataceae bacterium]